MSLSQKQIDALFADIRESLGEGQANAIAALDRICAESYESIEWRYELRGLLRGFEAAGILDAATLQDALITVFAKPAVNERRLGRERQFSLTASTGYGFSMADFEFDVAAMNPTDAYVQLSKRLAYKSLQDVRVVSVFEGLIEDRQPGAKAVKTFEDSELIFSIQY